MISLRQTLLLPALFALGLATDAGAQSRADQVLVLQRGTATPFSGSLVTSNLDEVVIEIDGKERKFPSERVLRVALNAVPDAWVEANKLLALGDAQNAAALYGNLAGDSNERDVLRAYARLAEARAYLAAGASDSSAFGLAAEAAQRLVADFPDHRETPVARVLAGRANLLYGEPAAAAESLSALFEEATAGDWPTGFPRAKVFEGALLAAHALVEAGDADGAGELYTKIERELGQQIAGLPEGSEAEAGPLEALLQQASLGEGWTLLAEGKNTPARSFFQSKLDGADGSAGALRAAARLGLATALEASGELRKAQLEYAHTVATATDLPEIVAGAMVGRARTTLELGDAGGVDLARSIAQAVIDRYGTTLALIPAQRVLSS